MNPKYQAFKRFYENDYKYLERVKFERIKHSEFYLKFRHKNNPLVKLEIYYNDYTKEISNKVIGVLPASFEVFKDLYISEDGVLSYTNKDKTYFLTKQGIDAWKKCPNNES